MSDGSGRLTGAEIKRRLASKIQAQELLPEVPIEVWKARLVGKRIVTDEPTVTPRLGLKTYQSQGVRSPPSSTSLTSRLTRASRIFVSPSKSPLLQLPTEIRLLILREVWTPTTCAVMFTCRRLYAEGQPLAMKACTFQRSELPPKLRVYQGDYIQDDQLNVYFDSKHQVERVWYG
ncbi:hypothetical protein MMC06_001946 [Schaereria dolodes]|nr:hypothetical protein [Schaereria dolodes]